MAKHQPLHGYKKLQRENGFTVLEVMIALFIFGCVSLAILSLIRQTDRIRGHAVYIEKATRLAADESERLRNIASQNGEFSDSSFTQNVSGRPFIVNRHVVTADDAPSYEVKPLTPVHIELTITDAGTSTIEPLTFNLLIGTDQP